MPLLKPKGGSKVEFTTRIVDRTDALINEPQLQLSYVNLVKDSVLLHIPDSCINSNTGVVDRHLLIHAINDRHSLILSYQTKETEIVKERG